MKKEIIHFRIKVANALTMSKAKKLIFVSHMPDGSNVYKTIAYTEKDDVFNYLHNLGCNPESVSKLNSRT